MSATALGVALSGECLRGEGLVWLIGVVVCLLAAAAVQCLLARTMDGRTALPHIGSCQSSATSEIVNTLFWFTV